MTKRLRDDRASAWIILHLGWLWGKLNGMRIDTDTTRERIDIGGFGLNLDDAQPRGFTNKSKPSALWAVVAYDRQFNKWSDQW
jgi:hypothetical protein